MIMTHTEITERVAATGPDICSGSTDIHAVAVTGVSAAGHAVLDYTDEAGLRPWQFSVAPMIDVTDRHCRYFHRLLAPNALLYTEMITTGALVFGDVPRHLQFSAQEHPVALQLGGSEPAALAHCARLGQSWGYDEINLNCGCPSERVQKGAFGACLMAEPALVADCVKAMQDAVSVPVTVKHRLGLDYDQSYDFVRDFVGQLYEVGCRVFYRACAQRGAQGTVS